MEIAPPEAISGTQTYISDCTYSKSTAEVLLKIRIYFPTFSHQFSRADRIEEEKGEGLIYEIAQIIIFLSENSQ